MKQIPLLKHAALLAVQCSLTAVLFAQTAPSKKWDQRFGGSDNDALNSLQQTTDGGYILGGSSRSGVGGDKTEASRGGIDYWIVKTSSTGTKQFDKRFGGAGDESINCIQQTKDGGYILGGGSGSGIGGDKTEDSRGSVDYWIVKTSSAGVKQWDRRFGGTGVDDLYSIQQTSDSGYILGGRSSSGVGGDRTEDSRGNYDYWIVKVDKNGTKQWDKRFGGIDNDYLYVVQQTSDGGYILGGASWSGIDGDRTEDNRGIYDYWIIKTDANGIKQWDKRFGGSGQDGVRALQQTTDGGYILGGFSSSPMDGDKTQDLRGAWDYWVVKIDANGTKQWDKRFGGACTDNLYSLDQTADGGYILGGPSCSVAEGDRTEDSRGGYDYWTVKIDGTGGKQWDKRFGGNDADYLYSLQQTTDGGYILGGTSYSGKGGDKSDASRGSGDFWIVKTKPDAAPLAVQAANLKTKLSNLIVAPNPASTQITIQITDNKILGSVSVYDASGRVLYQKFIGSSQAVIDIRKFSSGIYYVKAGELSVKFMKE